MNREQLAKEIRKITTVSDCLAGGSYPQSYLYIIADYDGQAVTGVRKQWGPHGNAYDPAAYNQIYVRFSLDSDDCVRYPNGQHAGRQAKGRDAVAILADRVADEILNQLPAPVSA